MKKALQVATLQGFSCIKVYFRFYVYYTYIHDTSQFYRLS